MNQGVTTPGLFDAEHRLLDNAESIRITGRVVRITGLVVECEGLTVPVGSHCRIETRTGRRTVDAEVVGFSDRRTLLLSLGDMEGIRRADPVRCLCTSQHVAVGEELLGRVLNSMGEPIDGLGPLRASGRSPLYAPAPRAMDRPRITEPLATGVRAIDGLITCGKGQRVGLFAGSGVGKSVLMGMISRGTSADVNVIVLVGERGRELRDFLEKDLGVDGLRRSVVVVATSDEPALRRVRAPFLGCAVAEHFRNRGADVLLLMDSITRLAYSQREVGLSAGEPPTTKGYPPSVFALLPRMLERAGRTSRGTITGIYTVLVDGDDVNEPIADAARSILDGHIWLSRSLASRGHYPAIDPLESVSRLMVDVTRPEHYAAAVQARAALAAYRSAEDLINIGAYAAGSNAEIDRAIRLHAPLNGFLRQGMRELCDLPTAVAQLTRVVADAPGKAASSPTPGRPTTDARTARTGAEGGRA